MTEREASREKFEAHMLSLNACTRLARQKTDGSYQTISVQRAWQLWQESRMQALRDFVAAQCKSQAMVKQPISHPTGGKE